MKFGEIFVFPDPASRVSHEPLKLVTDPQVRHLTKVHFVKNWKFAKCKRGKFT
jgi:hypothetical protein